MSLRSRWPVTARYALLPAASVLLVTLLMLALARWLAVDEMSRRVMLRRIVLPAAFRRTLPSYGNEVVMMLHGTSLASVVTLTDLTGAARELNARFYLPFESFIGAALIYLALTLVLVNLLRAAERRWLQPLAARS